MGKIIENPIMIYYRGGYKGLGRRRELPQDIALNTNRNHQGAYKQRQGRQVEAVREEEEPVEIQQSQPESEALELNRGREM